MEKEPENPCLVIDGMHNIYMGDNYSQGIREMNIDRANELKRFADIYSIPVLCTAEAIKNIGKSTVKGKGEKRQVENDISLSDIMESGKYAYNASVVWTLNPTDETGEILKLHFAKNKRSGFKGEIYLSFETQPAKNSEYEIKTRVKEMSLEDQQLEKNDDQHVCER